MCFAGTGKRVAETLTMDYHREHDLQVGAWLQRVLLACVMGSVRPRAWYNS